MKNRIWELDALRGVCILGMAAVHFVYDLTELYGILSWQYPGWFSFVKDWGGVLFLLISGICATLGSRSVRRGAVVFACGMVCTIVTAGMALLGFSDRSIVIYFGVLHCLGVCMVLWAALGRLSTPALAAAGGAMVLAGLLLRGRVFSFPWLTVLGFVPEGFASSDYFPLLPNLGFFLLGAVLGRTLYRKKETLLPAVDANRPAIRFLRACGRYSLHIYLLHQPVLAALCMAVSAVSG